MTTTGRVCPPPVRRASRSTPRASSLTTGVPELACLLPLSLPPLPRDTSVTVTKPPLSSTRALSSQPSVVDAGSSETTERGELQNRDRDGRTTVRSAAVNAGDRSMAQPGHHRPDRTVPGDEPVPGRPPTSFQGL